MKRNYIVKVTKNSRKFLLVEFDSSSCQSLSNFLNSEVHNFYTHIYKELEAVVTGQKEASDFGGNMLNMGIMEEF